VSIKSFSRCALITLALTASLTACGRRGDLEPAPGTDISARQAREASPATGSSIVLSAPVSPEGPMPHRPVRGVVTPKEPFILDPLL
jgi:predicted small lipoprotein YifL